MKATISKKFEDDHELFLANGGPGGAYEEFNYGDVLKDIDSYHAELKEHSKGAIEEINTKMREQATESLQ
jgi:hypothetical protein